MANNAQQEARCLIERIRREYTLDRAVVGPRFEALVSNSLEVLSSQLYEKSTHFLLEIIQNADDNTYNAPTPTLSFSYRPGSLRIDCNEVGFTADNVEAICAINQSTKSNKKIDGEYIGEKGIGFKSVFKAADVVWISSREYTFKFDQTKFLGMVTPIWAKFPGEIRPGWTSIHLDLSKGFDEGNLAQELLTFDANLLIYLRHVKEIHISVAGGTKDMEQKISKCEDQQGHDRIITLHAGNSTNRYLVRTHIVENLPQENKRPNWHRTKILLGFPLVQVHEVPQHAPQKVYAFLPIRSYGLKFLIQGDFLLTASREDIESTLSWNCRLRDAVAEAFLESVHHFNTGAMRYTWPCYLPDPLMTTNSFFDIAIQSIMNSLRELPVLESCAETMERAETLKSVPSDIFVDESGTPFTLSSRTATRYLSSKYPKWAAQGTRSIGVSQLSPQEFLEDFESLMNKDPHSIYTKPPRWHTQLAESLHKLTTDDKLLSLMQEIYPIPLQDGTWTTAQGKSIFFAKGKSSLEIPSGIDVLVAEGTIESDVSRRKLLVNLGVKAWEAPEICRLILRVHESPEFDAKALTIDQLISHTVFLYKYSWQPPKDVKIWFATMQDERCIGQKLYINGSIESNSPASRVFAKLQERFPVLHNGYLETISTDVKWPHWLVNNLGLSMIPRLITPFIEPKPQAVMKTQALNLPSSTLSDKLERARRIKQWDQKRHIQAKLQQLISLADYHPLPLLVPTDKTPIFSLSDEFIYMFSECRSPDTLQILRDNWHYYSQWISGAHMTWQDLEFLESCVHLKNRLGSCIVMSASGIVPLKDTVLPAIDRQLNEGCCIPAIDIVDPKHADWRLLGSFGVILIADVHYYLRCLSTISEQDHADIDHVAHIYDKIQSFYRGNEGIIQYVYISVQGPRGVDQDSAAFFETNIILTHARLLESPKPSVWTNMKDCLVRNISLEYEYPGSSYLFRCMSSPSGDPITSLVATAALISSSSKLEDISCLFRNISKALKDMNSSQAAQLLRPLKKCIMFPIVNDSRDCTYDRLASMNDISWFVADQPLIRKSFHSKLPLLALSTEDVAASKHLLSVLRLDKRLLSKLATNQTHPVGRVRTHWAWTSSLRAKRPFFRALIPPTHRNIATVMHWIENIRGSVVPSISQMYVMKASGITVEGNSIGGQTSLSVIGNLLNLYLTEEAAAAENPPYELSILLADQLKIKDANHRSLLYTVMISSNLESMYSTFMQQGIQVNGLTLGQSNGRYQAQRGDLAKIPSPFWGSTARLGEYSSNVPDVLKFHHFRSWRHDHVSIRDRRLPMKELMRLDRYCLEDIQAVPTRLKGWEHIQHLGEHLTSKILQHHLGHLYDPERDWTSELRCRSGHKPFASFDPHAAFTIKDPKIVKQMTAFVTSFGQSPAPDWNAVLQRGSPVYHLDVVVNHGSKASSFVLSTSQTERMRRYAIVDDELELNTNIPLLLKISDVYSSNAPSAELVIDPWRLLCSNNLQLESEWLITGTLTHDSLEPARKRRKLPMISVPWPAEGNPTSRQRRSTSSLARLRRPVFSHQALRSGEIRLINILPGTQQDKLHGVIIHVQLKSAPPYRALSYVWGTDQQMDGLMTPDGTLSITPALSKALCNLRCKDESITLWVDAICINQNDGSEKAKQIRMLPVIFQSASLTYAFLESREGNDSALEMLMQVCVKAAIEERSRLCQPLDSEECVESESDFQHSTLSTEGTPSEGAALIDDTEEEDDPEEEDDTKEDDTDEDDWPDDLPKVPAPWRNNPIPHLDDAIWISVRVLFSQPFFRRVWIVQEVVASFNVQIVCGRWTIDWSDLHRAMEIVDRQIQLFDTDTIPLSSSWEPFLSLAAQREWEARSHRWSLSMLLEHFRYAESTLSRDRLFAMLGLACDGDEADFEPDYNSPLEEVVLRFARVFVRQGKGMQLLYRAGIQSDHRFPSWVPDWMIQRPPSLADISEGGITFGASGPQQPMIKCLPNSDELLVDGYIVDEIENISVSSNVEEELASYFSEVDTMIDRAVFSPIQTSREDLKWKVPIAGRLFPKVATFKSADLRSSYTAFRNSLNYTRKGNSVDKTVGSIGRQNDYPRACTNALEQSAANAYGSKGLIYLAALQDIVYGWKFVVTKRGYVGTVPNLAQTGDVITIMKGGRVPFIVQKSSVRSGTFRLVGECYVHGLMNGEGLSLPDVVETTFTIY